MARPSMAGQRRREILDAFESCILRHGIAGTSLEMLAEAAGMKRSILRHYIGNRDAIIEALGERWYSHYDEQWQQTLAYLPESGRLDALVEILFAERDEAYAEGVIIGEALFIEAKRLPGLKAKYQQAASQFIEICCTELKRNDPAIEHDRATAIAHGLHGIYMMAESLVGLDLQQDLTKLRRAARVLLGLD